MGDKEVILIVEGLRIILDAAFRYAEMNNIPKEQIDQAWLESYAKVESMNPKDLPEVE